MKTRQSQKDSLQESRLITWPLQLLHRRLSLTHAATEMILLFIAREIRGVCPHVFEVKLHISVFLAHRWGQIHIMRHELRLEPLFREKSGVFHKHWHVRCGNLMHLKTQGLRKMISDARWTKRRLCFPEDCLSNVSSLGFECPTAVSPAPTAVHRGLSLYMFTETPFGSFMWPWKIPQTTISKFKSAEKTRGTIYADIKSYLRWITRVRFMC